MGILKIGKKLISTEKNSIYIIAEAGIGHFGSLLLAKKLVNLAKDSGADAIKFQAYLTEDLISKNYKKWFKRYKSKEVDLVFFKKIHNYCKKKSIEFLLTPHTESVFNWVKKLNLSAIKVGSGEIGNFGFLDKLMNMNKPLIISTGMHSLEDLKKLKNFVIKKRFKKICFLKCRTVYPTKDKDVHLNNFLKFKNFFKNYLVGYSDHTNHDLAIMGSVFFGAKIIEKHISIKFNVKNAQDWKVSFNSQQMKEMNFKLRRIENILGNPKLFVTSSELKSKIWATRSWHSCKNIKKNQILNKSNLIALRPGNGIAVSDYDKILGKKIKKNILSKKKILLDDLKN